MNNNQAHSLWDDVVARYFWAAKQSIVAANTSGDLDARAFEVWDPISKLSPKERVERLGKWIGDYKVSRRPLLIENEERPSRAFARASIEYLDGEAAAGRISSDPEIAEIHRHFTALRRRIGNTYDGAEGRGEKFLSLTSKVLWTRFPNHAPIYDALAENAIRLLAKMLKATSRIGAFDDAAEKKNYNNPDLDTTCPPEHRPFSEQNAAHTDGWTYRDYHVTHSILYERFCPAIEAQIGAGNDTRVTPFRIFDKILWLFGNNGLDYSFKGVDGAKLAT